MNQELIEILRCIRETRRGSGILCGNYILVSCATIKCYNCVLFKGYFECNVDNLFKVQL